MACPTSPEIGQFNSKTADKAHRLKLCGRVMRMTTSLTEKSLGTAPFVGERSFLSVLPQ
jgi:hypothetical protein